MTRSRRRKLQRLVASRAQRGTSYSKALMAGVPLAPLLLAGTNVALRATGVGRRPRRDHRHGAEARGEPAVRADQHPGAGRGAARAAQGQRLQRLREVPAEHRLHVRADRASASPYFRGVASGENNNHSGPSPSVGIYLDEQPITTIQGALDVHIYDVARVEALAGPQGTLFGASSQAGTIRIITNKPDPSGFDAGYGVEGNYVPEGDAGYLVRGIRQPADLAAAAVRLVGWARHDAGYIDNVAGNADLPDLRDLHVERHRRRRPAASGARCAPRTTTTTSTRTAPGRRCGST